ncbi:DUF3223 domain-containing protein [Hymenobacter baengnokdamensis]|uniref:DUF3223 domain-containing protein n=1 Tax=Hymenobacter baengnokdamensis TaxID=2615203 RepID=UPI00124893DB|nr:DUF3223 domain-containing protein [Hymenobacter baengnokdamensis]
MKHPIKIGERSFSFKKDALLHYKNTLNSYKFGQSLSNNDFEDLMALLNYEYQLSLAQVPHVEEVDEIVQESESDSEMAVVKDIIVSKVQFDTKCFEVFYSDNTSCYIS